MKLLVEIETDVAIYSKMVEFEEKGGSLVQAEKIEFAPGESCTVQSYWLNIFGGRIKMDVRGGGTTLTAGCILNVQGISFDAK